MFEGESSTLVNGVFPELENHLEKDPLSFISKWICANRVLSVEKYF